MYNFVFVFFSVVVEDNEHVFSFFMGIYHAQYSVIILFIYENVLLDMCLQHLYLIID